MSRDVHRSGGRITAFGTITKRGFGAVAGAATGMATVGAGAAGALAKSFIDTASDIEESLSKNRVLFGNFSKDIDKFSQTSADKFGVSRKAALEYTGVFGNLFRATGVNRRESAKFSTDLTKLAADMASFNNTSIEDALEAIRSGLVGESEPLRRFGVNINDARLKTEALRLGLIDNTKKALDPQTKAIAAQALVYKDTKSAQGDFKRTSEGLANQQKALKARFEDISGELGEKLLPVATDVVEAMNDLIDDTREGRGPLVAAKDVFEDIADAVGDVVGFLKDAHERFPVFTDALGKLALAGGVAGALKIGAAKTGLSGLATQIGGLLGKGDKGGLGGGGVVSKARPVPVFVTNQVPGVPGGARFRAAARRRRAGSAGSAGSRRAEPASVSRTLGSLSCCSPRSRRWTS